MSDQENEEQQQEQQEEQQQQSNENENQENNQEENNQENQEPQNEENNQEQNNEESQYEEPQKTYAPPNPSLKDCILLNQILPISSIDKNIDAISAVIYDNDVLLNEFLQKVDNRTEISNEDSEGPFIKCEQNRDGDSYRSPITNKYFPAPEEEGKFPSQNLRKLEEKLNKMFKVYTRSYYGSNAIVSCYCWDFSENIKDGFGVAVIIKNNINHENNINEANWNSTNIVTVNFNENEGKIKANYNLVTTVSLIMSFDNKICGKVSLSGMVARNSHLDNKIVKDYVNDDAHIGNIGVLIEDLESNIRNTLDVIYVSKSKEIIDTARFNPTLGKPGIAQALKLKEAFMQGMKK